MRFFLFLKTVPFRSNLFALEKSRKDINTESNANPL